MGETETGNGTGMKIAEGGGFATVRASLQPISLSLILLALTEAPLLVLGGLVSVRLMPMPHALSPRYGTSYLPTLPDRFPAARSGD